MDVLTDLLAAMRLSGGVVIDSELHGDWCLVSQFEREHCAAYFPVPGELIGYHYVRSGRVWAEIDGEPPVEAGPGSVLLVPRNERHRLYNAPGLTPVDANDLITPAADGQPARIVVEGLGPATRIYCGFLGNSSGRHPLLDALPGLMVIDPESDIGDDWLASSLRYAHKELRAAPPEVVARMAELFLAEAVRRHISAAHDDQGGWLAAVKDPIIARALGIIHTRYADDLDVEGLAREVGLSRSALGERFVTLLGEPPMRYCARWRMRMAANMLREGKQNSANIAYAVGFNSEAGFNRAFKREYGDPPAAWRRKAQVPPATQPAVSPRPPLPVQRVRYCSAQDGTRLAYSVVGEGPPLVKTANWLNHIEYDWDSPIWRHWIAGFAPHHRLVRYDERANGLSDWDTPEISFDAFVDDLDSVVEAAGLNRFDLLGISQGAAVAIAYAVRNPDRVRRLVIFGGYARGWRIRAEPDEIERREAMMTLARMGWGSDNPSYRQLFTGLYLPDATGEQAGWFNDMQRLSASPTNAVKLLQVFSTIDVSHLLSRVAVPTLVLHSRGDHAIPVSQGQAIADGIPGAIFELLDSDNHLLLEDEPAWLRFIKRVREFLEDDVPGGRSADAEAAQPMRAA